MAELLKVREITIDTMQYKDFTTKEEELKVMRFYQNDLNSAKLLINVTHDKVVTDFSTATKVQIAFLKPDGKRVFQDVQNVNQMQGKYYVVLSTQTLIAYGNVVAQLRLTFPNNKVIETCKYVFAVDESIMSDTAMESTNEFPVIQKAIEAGKKLEGVDIDRIIAAGAKADAALPKAGGTMTGDLTIDGANKGVTLKNGANTMFQAIDGSGDYYMYSSNGKTLVKYITSSDTFNVQAANTNLLKKTGDTVSGALFFDTAFTIRGSGATYDMRPYSGTTYSKGFRHTVNTANNYYALAPIDESGAASWANQLQFDGLDGTLTVSKLKTRKDGRVAVPLTADGVNFDTNYGPFVERRGNTVTFRGAIGRTIASTASLVATIPDGMRPALSIPVSTVTTDGTPVTILINTNGSVNLLNPSATSVAGKNVFISITYVAD
ncbi:BppU family phage baseplate upper protein [Bacillus mycoides]|uniref:BppU family phage baseplate upper protein n=1 Tax=Bacillus mycoides TaxID=1405 RepID=UPI00187919ED|nr:BppU family phage baseplate upper protein [Bacillus mycoides]MBE7128083.1 DUF2479 domain-containing protein [Bacillus mycoides]